MDESCTRPLHGGDERCRNLETAPRWNCPLSPNLRRIQGTCFYFFRSLRAGDFRSIARRPVEISGRSPSSEANGTSPYGGTARGAPRISHVVQKTDRPVFRSKRSHEIRSIVSLWPRSEQHDHRRGVRAVFPALGLALFHRRGGGGVFANLSRRALAQ